MNVKQILTTWLRERGYEGLFYAGFECGCEVNDLMPCGVYQRECQPGFKTPCDCGEDCEWHISGDRQYTAAARPPTTPVEDRSVLSITKDWTGFQEGHYSVAAERERNEQRENKAIELLKKHKPIADTVFDFGCGSGHLVAKLLADNYNPYGFDLPEVVIKCKERFPELEACFKPHNFNLALWNNGEADAIIALELIEHVVDDTRFLGLCAYIAPIIILCTPLNCTLERIEIGRAHV